MKKKADAEDIRIHDLRHSHAAMLIIWVLESKRSPEDWDTIPLRQHGIPTPLISRYRQSKFAGKIEDLIKKEAEEKMFRNMMFPNQIYLWFLSLLSESRASLFCLLQRRRAMFIFRRITETSSRSTVSILIMRFYSDIR